MRAGVPSRLILHVGMPKTGTSSIQETLFHGLTDPRFRYVGLGMVNGSRPIQSLVGDSPVVAHAHPLQGIDPVAMRAAATRFRESWERQVALARKAGATPVVSAEDCWFLTAEELGRLDAMIRSAGYGAQVVVYLRSPLGWLGSMYQELLKSGHEAFVDGLLIGGDVDRAWGRPFGCDYLRQLGVFAEVFGGANLTVRMFDRAVMAEGCVVMDFCGLLGIRMERSRVRRVNEGLSLDAARFVHAYNRFQRAADGFPFWRFLMLLRRLQGLGGEPLRLHPDLLSPVVGELEAQIPVLRERYGVELGADWLSADGERIRSEGDLGTFSRASLEWLSRETGTGVVGEGGDVARQVARLVGCLRPRRWDEVQERLRGRLRGFALWRANRW